MRKSSMMTHTTTSTNTSNTIDTTDKTDSANKTTRTGTSNNPRQHPQRPQRPQHPQHGQHRQQLGIAGEAVAARFLEARGYRIVARNVRADRVEIDLVARRGPLLVIVEVKSRASLRGGSAAEAVDERKQRRLRRGARAWLASRPSVARGTRRTRFDVVTCLFAKAEGTGGARGDDASRARGDASLESLRPERSGTPPFGSWVPNDTTAPDGARWWIEHWESAF
jgi:putative endonuclease